MAAPLETTQEVLDYLKTTHHDTYDMSRCMKLQMCDVLAQLFLRVNWMRTWFRTNHPTMMYKVDTPFVETVEFFKNVSEEDFSTVFTLWCLHLVQKFPIDSAYEVGGKITKKTEDSEKQHCILNLVSDLTFLSAAKPMLLSKTYLDDLGEVLKTNLVRTENAEFTHVTNLMLAQEMCTTLYFRATEARSAAAAKQSS
jgi:hypothetical protein